MIRFTRMVSGGGGRRFLSRSATLEVPVIDIAPLLTSPSSADSPTVTAIASACKKWGFFQAVGHGVDENMIAEFDRQHRKFFAMDKAQKLLIKRTQTNSRGYFDDELTKQTSDWKEGFDFGAQDGSLEGRSDVDGYNQWPVAPAGEKDMFRPAMEKYFSSLASLSGRLLSAMSLGMGQPPDFFEPQMASHSSFLRLNYYPPCPNPVGADWPVRSPLPHEGSLGINRHADAGLLTILRQRPQEPHSLQVYSSTRPDGRLRSHDDTEGRWVKVIPVEGAFTINIGDMMQVLSNDVYVAPLHRVLASSTDIRYSAPFFFNPPYLQDCSPMPSLGAPVFRPVNWGAYRGARFAGDYADTGLETQIEHFRIQ